MKVRRHGATDPKPGPYDSGDLDRDDSHDNSSGLTE